MAASSDSGTRKRRSGAAGRGGARGKGGSRQRRSGRRSGRGGGSRFRPLWWLVALPVLAGVLWLTVREDELVTWANLTGANLVPLRHHLAALECVLADCAAAAQARTYLWVDVVGNLLLFVPVGLVLAGAAPVRGRGARFVWGVVAAAALSVAIETIQLWLPSRATDVDDVLFNTVGAMLGALLLVIYLRRPARSP